MNSLSRSKNSRCLAGIALVLALALGMPTLAGDPGAEVSLRWALGAIEQDAAEPSAISRDTELGSGTRLKFLVEPLSVGSVYLLLLDSSDEISVLYRESVSPQDQGDPAYIPPGTHWFKLDDEGGMETFFLLASVEPLTELEALLDRYATADPAARADIGPAIVGEVRRLHKAHRDFARPVEKPVMIGGQTRGGPAEAGDKIDRLAVEITAEQFYGKTITIDH